MDSDYADIPAAEIESTGSCDELVRTDEEELVGVPSVEDIYMNSHVGRCMEKVLTDMLEEKEISIQQFISLKRIFNSVHREAFTQCQGRLHVTVTGTLEEYASVPAGSVFQIKDCSVSGPTSMIKIPKGSVSLVHSWDQS